MKRLDIIKSIYNTDILFSLASEEELTDEKREKMLEQLRQLQEQQKKLKQEEEALQEEEEFDEEDFDEIPEEPEEEPAEEEVEPEELPEELPEEKPEETTEEEVPDDEKLEMPSSLQSSETFKTEENPGILKKYSPGAVLAKSCPVCNYDNRPIYLEKCENCKSVYSNLTKYISRVRKEDPKRPYEQIFADFASKFKYITPEAMGKIFWSKGETPLKEVNEISYSPRKHLQDILFYRLNVKRGKNGEPILDKNGVPVPLDEKKYFGTPELADMLHISPEMMRKMVANYNEKVIEKLPPRVKETIRRDEWGEILPLSARQLKPYGYVAPAVVLGTGMADVRRRLPPEQEEKLSPEQVEGLKGPAFKSVDISAWNWDTLGKVFGWDNDEKDFTHGWGKFLKDKFIPEANRQKAENRLIAVKKLIEKFKKAAEDQIEDTKTIWGNQSAGLRFHTYLHERPELSIEDFKKEWEDEFEKFKLEYLKKVLPKKKIDRNKKIPPSVHKLLENYDKREKELTDEEYDAFVKTLADILKQPEEKIIEHLEIRDDANDLLEEKPKEIDFMALLENRPNLTREKLENQYENRRASFMKFVWEKKKKAATELERKAERLEEKIPELEMELEEAGLPHEINLNEEVKKYFKPEKSFDPDPKIDEEFNKELMEVEAENPPIQPPDPESIEKKSSRLDYIIKLAVGGELGLEEDDIKYISPEERKKIDLFREIERKKPENKEDARNKAIIEDTLKRLEKMEKKFKPRSKEEKVEIPKFITPAERKRMDERKEKRRKFLENLTPEQKREIEEKREEFKTEFKEREPEFKEPSGTPEEKPIRKIVIHRSIVKMDKVIKDPRTGKPKLDKFGNEETEEIQFMRVGKFLITIRVDDEGNPKHARCETISLGERETLETEQRRTFPKLYKEIRRLVYKLKPELKKNKTKMKEIIDSEYEKQVKEQNEEPWKTVRKKVPLLPESAQDLNSKPCKNCPFASAPFENACGEIQVAINSLKGEPAPFGYDVYDWETIERKPVKEKSYETIERRRRHDVPDFFADDKD